MKSQKLVGILSGLAIVLSALALAATSQTWYVLSLTQGSKGGYAVPYGMVISGTSVTQVTGLTGLALTLTAEMIQSSSNNGLYTGTLSSQSITIQSTGLNTTITSEKNIFSKSNGGQQLTISALGITYGTVSSQFGYPKAATYLTQTAGGCTLWNNVNITSCIWNDTGWSTLTLSGCSITPIMPMATVIGVQALTQAVSVAVYMTGTTQLNIQTFQAGSPQNRNVIITVFCL